LTQFGFWDNFSFLAHEGKFRLAYGESGNLPFTLRSAYEPIFHNLLPLRPERIKEFELGFDATIFNGNGMLELSYFIQNISDLLVKPQYPQSWLFDEMLLRSGGTLRTTGWNISLGLNHIRKKNFEWQTRINFYTTDSKITKLDGIFSIAGFYRVFRIQEGLPPTTIIEADRDGFTEDASKIGDENPDFQMSFGNNIRFGNFDLNFLWAWRKGGDIINFGKFLKDFWRTSPDYDELGEFVRDGVPTIMKKGIGRKLAGGVNGYIEDGSFIKLRELSLSYSFPSSVVSRMSGGQLSYLKIGLGGRNLLMFTGYSGYDPELSEFGNVPIARSIDTLPYPSSRSYYFNLSFGM